MNTSTVNGETFYFRRALSGNRLAGLWAMMTNYRLSYVCAVGALAISALAKTSTFLLLGYFADDVLQHGIYVGGTLRDTLALLGAGFIALAAVEGTFSYV